MFNILKKFIILVAVFAMLFIFNLMSFIIFLVTPTIIIDPIISLMFMFGGGGLLITTIACIKDICKTYDEVNKIEE